MNYLEIHTQPCGCPFYGSQIILMDDSDAHAAELQKLRQSNALLESQWHKAELEIESLRQSNERLRQSLKNIFIACSSPHVTNVEVVILKEWEQALEGCE